MTHQQFSPHERAAAYLSDSLRAPPPELPWSDCDVQTVVRILQHNKVPLLSLAPTELTRPLLNTVPFQVACAEEKEQLAGLREQYKLVKETLAVEGISDVMIKSVGLAPSFPYRSDNLDVLYEPQDVEQVRAILRRLGYVELRNVEEPHKYLFRKFHMGRSVSAIHVHGHVGWMVSFLDEQRLWQRCKVAGDDPLVTVPATEDALLTTLAHYFYEDKRVALVDVLKVAHCLRRGVDWDDVYRIAAWRGWRDGLNVSLLLCAYQEYALYGETLVPPVVLERAWHALPSWTRAFLQRLLGAGILAALLRGGLEGQASGLEQLPLCVPFAFSKVFFYAKLARDPTRTVRRRLKDLAVHTANGTKLRLRIHSQPRMLVTMSGVDGCGKTTQAQALQSAFHTCHLRANHVWNRGGSSRWVGPLTRWTKRRTDAGLAAAQTGPQLERVRARQKRFRSPWLRWGWSWLTTIELLLSYWRHVALPLAVGRVVICDRYVCDAFADRAAYFGEQLAERRLAAQVLRLLTPRPRVAYWLDVPAEVAQSRSGDPMPEAFLAAQSAAYSRMTGLCELRRLDGAAPKEAIADQIAYEVLDTYFSEYRTLINTLFLKNPGQWE